MTRHMSPGQGSISFASFIAALPGSAGLKPEGRGNGPAADSARRGSDCG